MTQPGDTPAVSARGLVHRYGDRRALDGFDLDIPAGSVFGILGPNGSGKTTFVSLLASMQAPMEGSLRVFGQPPAPALRARVGTVFQENAVDPLMSPANTSPWPDGCSASGGRPSANARPSCSRGSGSRAGNTNALAASRAGCGVAWKWPGHCCTARKSSSSTSRRPGSTSMSARPSGNAAGAGTDDDPRDQRPRGGDDACDLVAFVRSGQVVVTGTPASLKEGLRRDSVRVGWQGDPPATADEVGAPGSAWARRQRTVANWWRRSTMLRASSLTCLHGGRVRSARSRWNRRHSKTRISTMSEGGHARRTTNNEAEPFRLPGAVRAGPPGRSSRA